MALCRNLLMAERRARTRKSLIEATIQELEKVRGMMARGRLSGKEKIGVRVGPVINKYSGGCSKFRISYYTPQGGQAHPSRHRRGLV